MNLSYDPTYPFFPIFSFLGFVVSLIPLSWHIQAWNSGTCAYMIWTAIACLNSFINSIVWKNNALNVAPVWCDISSKLIIGVSVGIPASVLCISRRLYTLTAVQTVSITPADKRRMVLIDLCISVGIPILIMVLHYVVQGHRFDILGDVGCYPVVYNSILAYFIYFIWPLVLGVVSFVYSALTLRFFWLRRAQFAHLFSSNNPMTASRYLRLMLLAVMDMLCTVPLGVFTLYFGIKDVGIRPWISWEDTHFNFSRVVMTPSVLWRSDPNYLVSVELTRWLPVVCAFVFFALFGFAIEAKKEYVSAFWAVAMRLGFKRTVIEEPRKGNLPSWVKPFKTGSSDAFTKPSFPIPHNGPATFTSSTATDIELSPYSKCEDLEKASGRYPSSSSIFSPPVYPFSPSDSTSLDMSRDSHSEFPPTPTSDSPFSATTTASHSTTLKGDLSPPDLRFKLSLEPFAYQDRFYLDATGKAQLPSPPPFANVAAPTLFSSPLSYHEPSPQANASVDHIPDGIRVTIHTISTTSSELPSLPTFDKRPGHYIS